MVIGGVPFELAVDFHSECDKHPRPSARFTQSSWRSMGRCGSVIAREWRARAHCVHVREAFFMTPVLHERNEESTAWGDHGALKRPDVPWAEKWQRI